MDETLSLVCPNCKCEVCSICLKTVDWMLPDYCRKYLEHVDSCKPKTEQHINLKYFGFEYPVKGS